MTESACIEGFEGCEKRLEVDFDSTCNLRSLPRSFIETMLAAAKCSIISSRSNDFFDSYVLSESSLFVYPRKLIIKTCGTTTLLKCLPILLEAATEQKAEPTFVQFSRSDFLFPHRQPEPHSNFNMESDFLNTLFDGSPVILGPLNKPWWHLYTAHCPSQGLTSKAKRPRVVRDSELSYTFEMVMFNLDIERMKLFHRKSDSEWTGEKITRVSGIVDILPGATIDEHLFDPCGYSCNAMKDGVYFTIHVTPEPHCSFVSFETNLHLESYSDLALKILEIFKPGKFCLSLLVEGGAAFDSLALCNWDYETHGYRTAGTTYHTLEGNTNVTVGQYEPRDESLSACRA